MFIKQLVHDIFKLVAIMTIVTSAVLISVFGSVAKADSVAQPQAGAQAGSVAGAQSGSQSGSTAYTGGSGAQSSQSLGIDQRNYSTMNNPPAQLDKAIGYAPAVNLPSNFITCAQSSGASAGFMGGAFGFSSSYSDADCNRRQGAMVLTGLGKIQTAFALMCEDEGIRKAALLTSEPCPQDRGPLSPEQARANSEARMKILAEQYAAASIIAKPAPVTTPNKSSGAW